MRGRAPSGSCAFRAIRVSAENGGETRIRDLQDTPAPRPGFAISRVFGIDGDEDERPEMYSLGRDVVVALEEVVGVVFALEGL